MKAATHIPRCVGIVALAVVFTVSGLGASKKSRVFNAQFEAVWTAAAEVAKDAFLAKRCVREVARDHAGEPSQHIPARVPAKRSRGEHAYLRDLRLQPDAAVAVCGRAPSGARQADGSVQGGRKSRVIM